MEHTSQTVEILWKDVVRSLPWAESLRANLIRQNVWFNHVERRTPHRVWFVHLGIPDVLQERYGLAPELMLLVAQEIHGNDLAAVRARLGQSDRIDPDTVLLCDGGIDLGSRLRRLAPLEAHIFCPLSEQTSLESQLADWLPTRDLFDKRDPVMGRYQVWGREREHAALKRALLDGQATAVVGLRKIGKTTLVLGVLADLVSEGWAAHHVDLQALLGNFSTDALSRKLGSSDGSIEGLRHHLLKQTEGGKRIVLFLDEFDLLFDERCGADVLSLFGVLRGLVQEQARISVVLAGRDPSLLSLPRIHGVPNPFLVWTRAMWLRGLQKTVAEALLATIGARVGLFVDPNLVAFAWQWSAGHPLVHRLVGSRALAVARSRRCKPPASTAPLFDEICAEVQQDADPRRIAAEVDDLLQGTDAVQLLREASTGAVEIEGSEDAFGLLRDLDLLVPDREPAVPGYLRAWYSRRPSRKVRLSA